MFQNTPKFFMLPFLVASTVILSCQNDSSKVTSEKLTINDWNVENSGILHEKLSLAPSYGIQEEKTYRKMVALRSTVGTRQRPWIVKSIEGTKTCVKADGIASGSASLTSSTRFVSAAHASLVYDKDTDFNVYFEGYYIDPSSTAVTTGMQGNDPNVLGKENPYLSRRLFALGLDGWTQPLNPLDIELRNTLRIWPATRDSMGGMAYHPWSVDNLSNGEYSGRDLGVFKVSPDEHAISTPGAASELNSGRFNVYQPGPFFQITELATFNENEELRCDWISNEEEAQLTHNNYYNEATTNFKIPMMSYGYRDNVADICENYHDICIYSPSQPDSPFNAKVKYTGCIRTTFDILPGSSGGSLLHPTCTYITREGDNIDDGWTEDPDEDRLVLKGVLYGAEGVEGEDQPLATDWQDDYHFEYDEIGQTEFEDGYALVTKIDKSIVKWGLRDINWDASRGDECNPAPDQPSRDGCPGVVDQGKCYPEFEWSTSSAYSKPAIVNGGISYEEDGDNPNITDSGNNSFTGHIKELENDGYSLVSCSGVISIDNNKGYDRISDNYRYRLQMMQGIVGSSLLNALTVENKVDAISPLCIPWSSATWLNNWSFARVMATGTDQITKIANAINLYNTYDENEEFRMKLNRFLISAFEVVVEQGQSAVMEPSFKACPPNYYLNGLKYYVDSTAQNQGLLQGVKSLICRKHKTTLDNTSVEIDVPLSSGDDYTIQRPDSSDEIRYNISAHIGISSGGVSLVEDRCSNGKVPVGILMRRDNTPTQSIDYFKLLCVRAPEGGS